MEFRSGNHKKVYSTRYSGGVWETCWSLINHTCLLHRKRQCSARIRPCSLHPLHWHTEDLICAIMECQPCRCIGWVSRASPDGCDVSIHRGEPFLTTDVIVWSHEISISDILQHLRILISSSMQVSMRKRDREIRLDREKDEFSIYLHFATCQTKCNLCQTRHKTTDLCAMSWYVLTCSLMTRS